MSHKSLLLHSENQLAFIPIACSVHLKKSYGYLQLLNKFEDDNAIFKKLIW